jgi:hypothetical protein
MDHKGMSKPFGKYFVLKQNRFGNKFCDTMIWGDHRQFETKRFLTRSFELRFLSHKTKNRFCGFSQKIQLFFKRGG